MNRAVFLVKSLITILTVLVFLNFIDGKVSAQCSGRYYDKVFNAATTFDVTYGSAVNFFGSTQTLLMDIYYPVGDTATKRPLIILASGGSFQFQSRMSPDITYLCQEFAERGFVTVAMDYRVFWTPEDLPNMLRAIFRGVQDAKAVVRFFYKDAGTTNIYGIDTNHIYMGGTSAGAIIGTHLGYVRDTLNTPSWLNSAIRSIGGVDGNSSNQGYSSHIHGIINLCGMIVDSTFIEPGEPKMVSMHGDNDGTVPYCSDLIRGIVTVEGSGTMKIRTANVGIQNPFYKWRGADHVPYLNGFAIDQAYMDTTVNFIRDFLFNQITGNNCGQDLASAGRPLLICGQTVIDPVDSCFTQNIAINQGWNIISSYISPEEPNFFDLISAIFGDILIIKNGAGQTVIPSFGINGIGNWNSNEGYQVKSSINTTLTIGCDIVNPSATPINLSAGWSIIPYLRNSNMDIATALISIHNKILIVKDQAGNSYIPFLGINGIGNMHPGEGYKIKLSGHGTLIYPDN